MENTTQPTNNQQPTTKIRYIKLCEFNRILTLAEIEKELSKMGAKILTNNKKELIRFEVYTNDDNPQKQEAIKNLALITRAYDSIGCGLTLNFIYNGCYYSFEYDDNPFMPIMYQKIKIDENGNYRGARYLYSSEDLNEKSWKAKNELCFSFGYDNFFKICNDEEIKELAAYHLEQIKKEIFTANESASYFDQYHPRDKQYNIFVDERSYMKEYFLREKAKEEIAHLVK